MKYFKFYACLLSVVLSFQYLISQDKKDIALLENIFEPKVHLSEYKQYIKDNSNEFHWVASGLFIFYKSFFSSQDGNHCVFYPSCSAYTMQSIRKKGFIIGFADGVDRLSRCNRLSPGSYPLYGNTLLFYDPVW